MKKCHISLHISFLAHLLIQCVFVGKKKIYANKIKEIEIKNNKKIKF